jgi:hypothetical protein
VADKSHDRTSGATDLAASQLMLTGDLLSRRAVDALAVIRHLQAKKEFSGVALWGDSFVAVNPPGRQLTVPHNIDGQPSQAEPLGGQLAMICGAALADDIKAVYLHRAVVSNKTLFENARVFLPLDNIAPGNTENGGLSDWASVFAPRPLCLENPVDANDREMPDPALKSDIAPLSRKYQAAKASKQLVIHTGRKPAESAAAWLIESLRGE